MDAVSFEAHLSRYRVDVELKPEKRRDARCTDLE
jgi:hypothetical protein